MRFNDFLLGNMTALPRQAVGLLQICGLLVTLSAAQGCTLQNPPPNPIHGSVIHQGNTYKCWYTGPTYVSCTGGCGPVTAVSTIHNPLDLDSLHSVCSCCGSTVNLVTEAIFRCEFLVQLSGTLLAYNFTFDGSYYSFENCGCTGQTTGRRKRDVRNTEKGHFCRQVNNTKFKNQCQANSTEGVTVCYSKTRWAVPQENLEQVSQVMRQKMETEESGIYQLPPSIQLIEEHYQPRNPYKFPANIFKSSNCDDELQGMTPPPTRSKTSTPPPRGSETSTPSPTEIPGSTTEYSRK